MILEEKTHYTVFDEKTTPYIVRTYYDGSLDIIILTINDTIVKAEGYCGVFVSGIMADIINYDSKYSKTILKVYGSPGKLRHVNNFYIAYDQYWKFCYNNVYIEGSAKHYTEDINERNKLENKFYIEIGKAQLAFENWRIETLINGL